MDWYGIVPDGDALLTSNVVGLFGHDRGLFVLFDRQARAWTEAPHLIDYFAPGVGEGTGGNQAVRLNDDQAHKVAVRFGAVLADVTDTTEGE